MHCYMKYNLAAGGHPRIQSFGSTYGGLNRNSLHDDPGATQSHAVPARSGNSERYCPCPMGPVGDDRGTRHSR